MYLLCYVQAKPSVVAKMQLFSFIDTKVSLFCHCRTSDKKNPQNIRSKKGWDQFNNLTAAVTSRCIWPLQSNCTAAANHVMAASSSIQEENTPSKKLCFPGRHNILAVQRSNLSLPKLIFKSYNPMWTHYKGILLTGIVKAFQSASWVGRFSNFFY